MAMTSVVKDELSRVPVIKPCCRKAEVSTLLRFAGGLHLAEGRVVIEAGTRHRRGGQAAAGDLTEVFGHPAIPGAGASGLRKGSRYLVRVDKGHRQRDAGPPGRADRRLRPSGPRPAPAVGVRGYLSDCAAAWRGAFLAHGSLTNRRSMALEITCPGSEGGACPRRRRAAAQGARPARDGMASTAW